MKKDFFKSIACGILMLFSLTSVQAQSIKESFSAEGRKNWKPEITLRGNVGIFTGGAVLSGGVRIDEKRTLGLMVGEQSVYLDAEPATIDYITTALSFRRYFHLGARQRFAFYIDFALGAAFVTDWEGAYWVDPVDGATKKDDISVDKGDAQFYISWQPGVRVRFFDNVHLFLGPTLSSHCLGVHLGIGF
jgi:hypothetical protein